VAVRIISALGLVMLVATAARADDPPFTIGAQPSWVLLGGVSTGATVALADRGYLLGGELSLARLREANHIGIYADGYYDWGTGGAYTTAGIELGRKILGLDGGVALRFAGQRETGFTGRISFGVGVFSIYGRFLHFVSDTATMNENVIQVGVQLKLPLKSFGGSL
jgi:hypothetical protein